MGGLIGEPVPRSRQEAVVLLRRQLRIPTRAEDRLREEHASADVGVDETLAPRAGLAAGRRIRLVHPEPRAQEPEVVGAQVQDTTGDRRDDDESHDE